MTVTNNWTTLPAPAPNFTDEKAKSALFKRVQQYKFAVNDLVLFLDTHPTHKEALDLYHKYRNLYLAAQYEYDEKYGPLSVNEVLSDSDWTWVRDKFPWEN